MDIANNDVPMCVVMWSKDSCIMKYTKTFFYMQVSPAMFLPSSVSCPPGHVLSPAPIQPNLYTSCQCNQDNPDVLECDGRRIVLQVT